MKILWPLRYISHGCVPNAEKIKEKPPVDTRMPNICLRVLLRGTPEHIHYRSHTR